MKMQLEIDYEISDKIVKQALLETYRSICDDIGYLKEKESLRQYQIEDLSDFTRNRDAIKIVLQYFMTHEEFEEEVGEE